MKALPGVEQAMKLTGIKIIAPSNLAIQKYMDGERIPLRTLNLEQRFSSSYGSYREFSESRFRQLEVTLPRTNSEFDVLEKKYIDPVRSFAAAVRDVEYSFVMRASRGLTTHIDVGHIANEGGRLGDLQLKRYDKGLMKCERVLQ